MWRNVIDCADGFLETSKANQIFGHNVPYRDSFKKEVRLSVPFRVENHNSHNGSQSPEVPTQSGVNFDLVGLPL
jgi:hypothetical protein